MSEQTPETENGIADGQEPSMEDILASIRKIIAEDDVQAPAETEAMAEEVVSVAPAQTGDVSELGSVETLDLDIITDEGVPAIDADIEALIGDMDASASDDIAPNVTSTTDSSTESLDDILELEIPMDETETLLKVEDAASDVAAEIDLVETEALTLEDELIDLVDDTELDTPGSDVEDKSNAGLMGGVMAAMGLGGAAAIAKADDVKADVKADGEDDLSLMLDNMLEDSSAHEDEPADISDDRVVDPAADLIDEDLSGDDLMDELDFLEDSPEPLEAETSEVLSQSDPDIDLVKSLMADLSETPLHEEDELIDAETESSVTDDLDDLDASSDDILDEILSVTIEDETKLSEEIAIPEVSEAVSEDAVSESLSLKEIAAAAQADAESSDKGISAGAMAGLGAAAIGGAAAAVTTQENETPEESVTDLEETLEIEPQLVNETENNEDDVDTALSQLDNLLAEDIPAEEDTLTPEPIIEETPEMPRAKKTDAIIDEVTETATAGAFASLSSVVEEKATVAERGDRIGDLVMEALQPMLKEWLDANLKGIVERAVTKEVKRISSGK